MITITDEKAGRSWTYKIRDSDELTAYLAAFARMNDIICHGHEASGDVGKVREYFNKTDSK